MPGNIGDVVGGEGEELVEDEANYRPFTDSSPVLRLDDKLSGDVSEAENENFPSPSARSNLILVRPANEWTRSAKEKVICVNSATSENAGFECEPYAEVIFGLDCKGGADKITSKLVLDQVDFGMKKPCSGDCSGRNGLCGPKCETAFIQQITIKIVPKNWTERDLRQLTMQPHHTAQEFLLQRSSSCTTQIPFFNPKQASASYQRGQAVSQTALAYGFSPARQAGSGVTWSWKVLRYGSSKELKLDKVIWGRKPELPIPPDHLQLHRESFRVEAEWELEPHTALQPLEFDCKIELHTAKLQRKRKARLPAYSVTTGPTVHFETVLTFNN